ncbi:protein kinase domain-containing protein [Actinokineospora sp. HUAS TT18]|uniref:protein kinase domain-containing protein n=1 Tax=Actinokineospora sp. HUAS TT18 TaxID=3447451 RepID=UPI003F527C91
MDAVVGGYVLREQLGRGGFGVVWRAESPAGEQVALKVMHPEYGADAAEVGRFLSEFAVLMRLDHANIVNVRAVLSHEGRPVLVMDLVRGRTLSREISSRGPLPEAEVLRLALQVCAALAHAHACGVVHRDLKPDNLLLEVPDGADPLHDTWTRARLVDFGIALLAGAPRHTGTGILLGTPSYLAPELLRDDATTASDVYGIGLLIYECLVGTRLHDNRSVTAIQARLDAREVELPRHWSSELRELTTRCLATDPADRPSVPELAGQLTALLSRGGDTDLLPSRGALPAASGHAPGAPHTTPRPPDIVAGHNLTTSTVAAKRRGDSALPWLLAVTGVLAVLLVVPRTWPTRGIAQPTPPATTPTSATSAAATAVEPTSSIRSTSVTATAASPSRSQGTAHLSTHPPVTSSATTPSPTSSVEATPSPAPKSPILYRNDTDFPIPDNQPATYTRSSVRVPAEASGTVGTPGTTAVLDVVIVHQRRADLLISLTAPDGAKYTLHYPNPYDRTADFRLNTDLAKIVRSGTALTGTWSLEVSDTALGSVGRIDWLGITA